MPLGPVASNGLWDAIYDRLVELVAQHRSTLVFVNTRRMAERLCHELGERIGEENVVAHHGSLSRKLRRAAEKKLKEGQVRVLVATASLELGIDVGTVDLAVQINSPRAIAVALQRVGRSGHWRGAVPKGKILCNDPRRSDGMRGLGAGDQAGRSGPADYSGSSAGCAGAADCGGVLAASGDVARAPRPRFRGDEGEAIEGIEGASTLTAVSQDLGSQVALADARAGAPAPHDSPAPHGDGWDEDELFALVKRAYPYRNLERETFNSILKNAF